MELGELRKLLADVPQKAQVYFDFAHCFPTKIDSWRGIYAEPALGWAASGYSRNDRAFEVPTAAQLVGELDYALSGREYTGWKGGDFTYNASSPLHIDNPGDCSNTEIVGVDVIGDYLVIIKTEHAE